MQVKDLKQDHRNYRKHNERNLDLIKKSINEVGLGRSIVIDSENEIVCGNGLVSQLDKNTPVKVIETDGSELVVVKRTDLNTDDEKRKKLAVMDNSTSDSSEFDLELLSVDFEVPELKDMGIDIPSIEDCEIEMPELASGDKAPFQQMAFTLADGQAEVIKEAIVTAKKDQNYDFVEKMGNENSNGNALFMIVQEWLNGKC
jgi:hypothetical protein